MTSQELGEILIEVFKDCSLDQVIAYQENDTINDYLKDKLSPEKFEEVNKADPLIWIDAIRILYLSRPPYR
ncbi:hypothetical protein [Desulfotruncus alcoholivorax]|uniref:hypothetical protein n=1 Tax=Desulfotruncus alcoholivorax TaxID=265477 RepID=UPI00040C773B|nr:hypothetical protein [Desulfotruncus alcoholivorax]